MDLDNLLGTEPPGTRRSKVSDEAEKLARNCLSYWFPKLAAAGIPVPRTTIVRLTRDAQRSLSGPLDGKPIGEDALPFLKAIREATEAIGLPCFLRTGQGSGKHSWERTCFLQSATEIGAHMMALIEWSEFIDVLGLPWDVWAVRELLPTKPICVLPMYGNMPLCREFREFVVDGDVRYVQPYWPEDSIRLGFVMPLFDCEERQELLPENIPEIIEAAGQCDQVEATQIEELAHRAGLAVAGKWSIDILDTRRGWYVTDMALAERSYGYDPTRMEG